MFFLSSPTLRLDLRRAAAVCFATLPLLLLSPASWSQKNDDKTDTGEEPETDDPVQTSAGSDGFNFAAMDEETYVLGNTLITLYHELGHGLVELGGLPLLGREEDAVDDFALVELVSTLNNLAETPQERQRLVAYGYATVDNWLKSAVEAGQPYTADYFGPHALHWQRHFNTACLLYGGSSDSFGGLIDTFDLPSDLSFRCRDLYFTAYDGWAFTLDTFGLFHDRGDADEAEDVVITILPADRAQHNRWAQLIEDWDELDEAMAQFSQTYHLSRPIQVRFESCGEENAYYYPDTNSVSMCYELMAAYARHHSRSTQAILDRGY